MTPPFAGAAVQRTARNRLFYSPNCSFCDEQPLLRIWKEQDWKHARTFSSPIHHLPQASEPTNYRQLLTPQYFASKSLQLRILPVPRHICDRQPYEIKDFRDTEEKNQGDIRWQVSPDGPDFRPAQPRHFEQLRSVIRCLADSELGPADTSDSITRPAMGCTAR
jgi:hypothetical protein